jgi:hypothetical protein
MQEGKGAQLYLMVCTQLRMQSYLMVGTQLLLFWLDLQPQASSCLRPLTWTKKKTTGCSFPCLQGAADALLGMSVPMQENLLLAGRG